LRDLGSILAEWKELSDILLNSKSMVCCLKYYFNMGKCMSPIYKAATVSVSVSHLLPCFCFNLYHPISVQELLNLPYYRLASGL
jgi:hypothetical protein